MHAASKKEEEKEHPTSKPQQTSYHSPTHSHPHGQGSSTGVARPGIAAKATPAPPSFFTQNLTRRVHGGSQSINGLSSSVHELHLYDQERQLQEARKRGERRWTTRIEMQVSQPGRMGRDCKRVHYSCCNLFEGQTTTQWQQR